MTVAAAIGAVAAWRGVSAWRKQIRGQSEYEVARTVLRTTFRVRDALSMLRSPFMSGGEMAAALKEVDPEALELPPLSEEARYRQTAAGFAVRWRVCADALGDLALARLEAEAFGGADEAACLKQVRRCGTDLNVALQMYLKREREGSLRPPTELDEEHFRTVYGTGDPATDTFAQRLDTAVEAVEASFRPRLQ